MQKLSTLDQVCYNTAHMRRSLFGSMRFDEVCEYIAGKYLSTPAIVSAKIKAFQNN